MEDFAKVEFYLNDIKRNLIEINKSGYFKVIAERGEEYYKENRVKSLEKVDEITYKAVVIGTQEYEVFADMNGRRCQDIRCSCPYNKPNEIYINIPKCKHIYAVEKAIYEKENLEYLKDIVPEVIEKYSGLDADFNRELIKKAEKSNDAEELMKEIEKFVMMSAKLKNKAKTVVEVEEDVEEISECAEEEKVTTSKKDYSEILNIFKGIGVLITRIFAGIVSGFSMKNAHKENEFDVGDMVRDNLGRIGVIISSGGDGYYQVKFKDEFENEFVENKMEGELERY